MTHEWQKIMDAAFDKYFAMSPILQSDMEYLFQGETDSQSFRRNFIRASAALTEGYLACFRDMCKIGINNGQEPLTNSEFRAMQNERLFGSEKRLKLTIRATYKLFELQSIPDFGVRGWEQAKKLIAKRDSLMHPKCVDDLKVDDALWEEIYQGAEWLFKQLFGLVPNLANEHGT